MAEERQRLWASFTNHYPKADLKQFQYKESMYNDGTMVASNIIFKGGLKRRGVWGTPIGIQKFEQIPEPDRTTLYHALGIPIPKKVIPFPKELQLGNFRYPIPAYPFSEKGPDITPMLKSLQIFVDPNIYFTSIVKDIWKETTVTHTSGKESKKWLAAPSFDYWPQQLNFAIWCATSGCGISITDPQVKTFPPVIQGLLQFHVYFTVRRILYELKAALPGDKVFKQTNNSYSKMSLENLCIEFDLPIHALDFRWKGGENHGLGRVWGRYYPSGKYFKGWDKRIRDAKNDSPILAETYEEGALNWKFFTDVHHGYNWFAPKKGEGLTKAGMGRINRSIESFVYCVLGAQAKTHTTIAGNSGGAVETRQLFRQMLEKAIVFNDIAAGIQNYQRAVTDTHAQLNLAVAPGLWLLPSNLIINTESIVGYNNGLQKATTEMDFGINQHVNETTHKRLALQLSQPVAKIQREEPHRLPEKPPISPPAASVSAHEGTLITITIAAAAAGWWMFR